MLNDAEIKVLLLATAGRDADAFGRLYRLCAPLLMGVAMRIVSRREMAEDVLHDAFVRIWNGAKSFDPKAAQPVAWMVAIARNRALDVMASADQSRVQSVDQMFEDDSEGALDRLYDWGDAPDAGAVEDTRRSTEWLRGCLGELAAVERQALVLAYQHGLSHSELSTHLAKPLGTVKGWVRRGLQNLRTCVESCMADGRRSAS